ncbi:hypothetical protein BJV74DRAFT_838369, partial [Russula compacta]
ASQHAHQGASIGLPHTCARDIAQHLCESASWRAHNTTWHAPLTCLTCAPDIAQHPHGSALCRTRNTTRRAPIDPPHMRARHCTAPLRVYLMARLQHHLAHPHWPALHACAALNGTLVGLPHGAHATPPSTPLRVCFQLSEPKMAPRWPVRAWSPSPVGANRPCA